MRIFVWTLRFLLLLALIGLASKNDEAVTVHFFAGAAWQTPLSFLILSVFVIGVIVGIVALLPAMIAQRRELNRLRKLRGEAPVPKSQRPQYPDPS